MFGKLLIYHFTERGTSDTGHSHASGTLSVLGHGDDRPEWLQLPWHMLSTPKSRQLTLVLKHGFRSLMLDIPPAL